MGEVNLNINCSLSYQVGDRFFAIQNNVITGYVVGGINLIYEFGHGRWLKPTNYSFDQTGRLAQVEYLLITPNGSRRVSDAEIKGWKKFATIDEVKDHYEYLIEHSLL